MKRIVVTGQGAVSSCGIGAQALWHAARDGISGVKPVTFEDIENQRVSEAAVLSVEDRAKVDDIMGPHRMRDPFATWAILAAREAVGQAGLDTGDFGDRCGVVIGSGFGGGTTLDQNYMSFGKERKMRLDPMAIPKIMNNAAASWVSMEFGATGPVYCPSTACSSGSQAIGLGVQLLRAGAMDRCLVGGSEVSVVAGVFRVWELLRVMTAGKNRPFSKDRNGMTLGEGAAVLVLETLESAQARGAEILCEIAGFGTNSDAGDLLRPNSDRAVACMQLALAEATALRGVFGDDLSGLEVSSTKPIHGHCLGSAGALELIVALNALREQIAPPTINFNEIDPKIGLEPVPNVSKPISTKAVMSNSLAFGGINATLVVKTFE